MEWALFIRRESDLSALENPLIHLNSIDDGDPHKDSEEYSHIDVPPFNRTYFGNEFCEALIPDVEHLERALFRAQQRGLSFTFVTPQVTDEYLEQLRACFRALAKSGRDVEVVVNDWGVMRVLRTHYPELIPVMGRIMNRGGRFFERSNASNLTYFPYRRFLLNYGVRRIEFDCPRQFGEIDFKNTGLTGSIYFPYSCCVSGFSCTASDPDEPGCSLPFDSVACCRSCSTVAAVHSSDPGTDTRAHSDTASQELLHSDQTMRYGDISEFAEGSTIDRIVYQLHAHH